MMSSVEFGIRYLSRRDVERLVVSAREIADRLETLLLAERAGDAWEAPKSSIAPGGGRFSLALLSAAREPSLSVLKTLGLSPDNAARGLPHIGGVIHVQGIAAVVGDADAGGRTGTQACGLRRASSVGSFLRRTSPQVRRAGIPVRRTSTDAG